MKHLYLLLALCVYTQSFGYHTYVATFPSTCMEKSGNKDQNEHVCCASKHHEKANTESKCEQSELSTDQEENVTSCCSSDGHEDSDKKGCCGGKDCDCQCCFHFHGLQVLFHTQAKSHHQNQKTGFRSKYTFQDALQKDLFSNIFHPPQL